jgi:hypothetical protein
MTELKSGQFALLSKTTDLSGYLCFTLNKQEHILIYSVDNLHECRETLFKREWQECWLYQDIMALYPDTKPQVLYDYMMECLMGFTTGMLKKMMFDTMNDMDLGDMFDR